MQKDKLKGNFSIDGYCKACDNFMSMCKECRIEWEKKNPPTITDLQKAQARIQELEHEVLNQKQQVSEACAGRDQWRKNQLENDQLKARLKACRSLRDFHLNENIQLKADLAIVRDSHKRQGELNTRIHARLAEAEKVIEFYAEPFNWHPYQDKTNGEIWDNDSERVTRNNASAHLPGKKAREYLAKKSNPSEIPNSSKEGKK